MVQVAWEGTRVFANGFLPPAVFGAVSGNNPYRQDVERARELLEEAGFGDGLSLTITTNGDNNVRIMMATVMEQQLAEVGIDVDINLMEFAAMIEMLDRNEGEHELVILGWTTVTGDADYGLFPLYHSDNHGPGGNRSNFDNARFDELVEEGRTNPDPAARAAAYAEAQEILAEYVPTMMVDFSTWSVGAQSFIRDFVPSPAGHHFFGNLNVVR
jgi:peptide/nickel transport system substrate-binding protein